MLQQHHQIHPCSINSEKKRKKDGLEDLLSFENTIYYINY